MLFHIESKSIYATIQQHEQKVTGLSLCNYLGIITMASCSKDNRIKLLNISEKTHITSFECLNNNQEFFPKEIIYCHDNKSLIITHGIGQFIIFDYLKPDKKKRFYSNHDVPIICAIYLGDWKMIIGGNNSSIDFSRPIIFKK